MTVRVFIKRDPAERDNHEEVTVEVWQGGGDSDTRRSRITDFHKAKFGGRVLREGDGAFDEVVYPQQMLIIRVYPKMKEIGK